MRGFVPALACVLAIPALALAYPPATVTDITRSSVTIRGLDCATRYQIRIREWRNGAWMDTSYHTPTTAACATPPPPPDTDGDGVPDVQDRCPGEAGPVSGCPVQPPQTGLPLSRRLCFNTHLHYTNSPYYTDPAGTKAKLDYTGSDCVRDWATPTVADLSRQAPRMVAIDADVIAYCGGHFSTWAWENNEAACVNELDGRVPRLVAVEAMNEPYGCRDRNAGWAANQSRIAGHVNRLVSAAAARGLDAYSVGGCWQAGTVNWWTAPLIQGANAVNNIHSYSPPGAYPSLADNARYFANMRTVNNDRWAATEMGPNSFESHSQNPTTHAAYVLITVLNHLYHGAERFAIYELIDNQPADQAQGSEDFGIYDFNGAKRPAADALHRMMGLLGNTTTGPLSTQVQLSDPAAAMLTFTDGQAEYVALWNRSSVATRNVTLGLGAARAVTVHQPVTGTVDSRPAAMSHSVPLGNHPVVIRVG
jgi:hypothetical protein